MVTIFSSHVLAAPAPVPDDVADSGRSGYNSVEVTARAGAGTDGRSGYNSVEVTARDDATGSGADGRSGYN